ncbi:MAG: M20/M25/M40 family metallo-hydrolase, partial [Candidatus Sulfotelmatobacter sp.]
MTDSNHNAFNRREFIHGALAGAAFAALPTSAFSSSGLSPDDRSIQSVLSQIPKMHDENVKRLQNWIALPSIAAENRNYPQGPEYMAQLARDAGFANVEIVPTSGKSGVFGILDAGAATTVGIYFMYDVKQFDPSEWSSPPLEGRIVDKEGLGRICVGRGAVNQKGPETAFLGALHAFKAAGKKLPVNLVLVCEGEEEIGSTHFPEVIHQSRITDALK